MKGLAFRLTLGARRFSYLMPLRGSGFLYRSGGVDMTAPGTNDHDGGERRLRISGEAVRCFVPGSCPAVVDVNLSHSPFYLACNVLVADRHQPPAS